MTTHGELLEEAEVAVARAATAMARDGQLTSADASTVFRQHDRLMTALARHLDYIHSHPGYSASTASHVPSCDTATRELITALRQHEANSIDPPRNERHSAATRQLSAAADTIRLATDVLATHHDPDHRARTPDADIIDEPHARWGVTVRAADLAYTTALATSRTISRIPPEQRPRHAGRVVSGAGVLSAVRAVLTTAASTGPGSKAIGELPSFAAPLPRTNPLASAATAFQYARAETYRRARSRQLGASGLRDVALLGLSLAQHTDAVTRAAARRAGELLPADRAESAQETLRPAADTARDLARRWRDLYDQLRHLRSPDPPQAGLAHATLAVRAGLEPHTRRYRRWATPEEMHPTYVGMADLLTGVRVLALPLDELADTGRRALADLHHRDQLYIHAPALPADPKLFHAQKTGRYIPVPTEIVEGLVDSWNGTADTGLALTEALAASTGLVGRHPRPAAAMRAISPAAAGWTDTVRNARSPRDFTSSRPGDDSITKRAAVPTVPSGETVCLRASLSYTIAMATSCHEGAASTQDLIARIRDGEVGGTTVACIAHAQKLLSQAGSAFHAAHQEIRKHASVKDAYDANPPAGTKQFLLASYRPPSDDGKAPGTGAAGEGQTP